MRWLFWLLSITGLALVPSVLDAKAALKPQAEAPPTALASDELELHTQAADQTRLPTCAATIREHPRSPVLNRESRLVVGNKGEEVVEITAAEPCDNNCWVFDHAEIEIYAQRFGTAQFVSLPPMGCTNCSPIRVRWYHEPTGYLSFAIRLFQRQLPEGCEPPPKSSEFLQ